MPRVGFERTISAGERPKTYALDRAATGTGCLQYSNIKLNTSICLSFMYIVCKKSTANLKLTDKLIISPDTSTLYGELCWLTWLQNQEASGQKQRLIVWVLPVTEWLVSNCATRVLIRTYKFMTANRSLPPFRIFVTRSPWRQGFRGTESEKHSSRASLLRLHGFSRTSQKFIPSNIDVTVAKRMNCGTQDLERWVFE